MLLAVVTGCWLCSKNKLPNLAFTVRQRSALQSLSKYIYRYRYWYRCVAHFQLIYCHRLAVECNVNCTLYLQSLVITVYVLNTGTPISAIDNDIDIGIGIEVDVSSAGNQLSSPFGGLERELHFVCPFVCVHCISVYYIYYIIYAPALWALGRIFFANERPMPRHFSQCRDI